MTSTSWPLLERLNGIQNADDVFTRFVDYTAQRGLSLYAAQEEAILEIMTGKHIVLNTPTGSGKSLVATAMIFKAMAEKKRAFYTCPIKALVSEKFFALCQDFGPENVGMMTGDAAINRDAPVVCCTAEVLSNMVLRQGEEAHLDVVIMDEFHYYADRERGVAWQIPLLVLEKTTFMLMSATLGNPEGFAEKLNALTGRDAAVIKSTERPVPLDYDYRETPLHETVDDLIKTRKYPIYMVNFTQRAAAEEAQNLMSINFCSKEEKQAINEALNGVVFNSPYGKEIQKFLRHGLGIHHAGLLPKYRLITEKLAQQGLLKIISGTDTLGVGVNIPIRTVLFTKLCKYDGEKTTILSVRDFKQISGRAGRKGFDDQGSVVVQAPEHVIENLRIEAKRASDPAKYKKLKKAQPPDKGFIHWDRQTFDKLIARPPEELPSRFTVTHGMLVNLLQSKVPVRGGGYGRLMQLIARSHGEERAKRAERRRARLLFKSLRAAGIIRVERVPMAAAGAYVEVAEALQRDFSINQTLGLYLLETLELLDKELGTYPLDVLTLVESILEDPEPILYKQLDHLKGAKVAEMKANGVEYDKRMEELEKLEHPKPNRDFVYNTFNTFSAKHPWVGRENIKLKSVAREMFEKFSTFPEYIKEYDLQRVEGLLLRYVSDVYKTVTQAVPEAFKTEEVLEVQTFFRIMVHQTDKSLVEEWESLKEEPSTVHEMGVPRRPPSLADNPKLLRARIRQEVHRLVKALADKEWEDAALCLANENQAEWTPTKLEAALQPYFTDYPILRMDHDARSPRLTLVTESSPHVWNVKQTLMDPEGDGLWFLDLVVDLQNKTGAEGPLLHLRRVGT